MAGEEIAKETKSDIEAINLGIGFEKDSIIFYEGMKKVVPEYDHKILEALISQEEGHLRQLSELKKESTKPPRKGIASLRSQ